MIDIEENKDNEQQKGNNDVPSLNGEQENEDSSTTQEAVIDENESGNDDDEESPDDDGNESGDDDENESGDD